jgi:hypothetical protein
MEVKNKIKKRRKEVTQGKQKNKAIKNLKRREKERKTKNLIKKTIKIILF